MNKKQPLISVIVPVFNLEEYIDITIKSILSQSYLNLEIIIIDDGSLDQSLKICQNLALTDKRIKVFHQNNNGVSSARNYGISKSCGEYVIFVDGDDIIDDSIIELMQKSIQNSDLVCVGITKNKEINNKTNKIIYLNKIEALKTLTYNDKINFSACGKLYKTEIVKNILFDTKTSILEDYLFVCNYISKITNVAIIDNNLYYYRTREGSALKSNFSEKRLDIIYSFNSSFEVIKNVYPNLLPYYICAYLDNLISLKYLMIKEKIGITFINLINKEINKYNNYYLKGSKLKRLKIFIFKINHNLYFKCVELYRYIKLYTVSIKKY